MIRSKSLSLLKCMVTVPFPRLLRLISTSDWRNCLNAEREAACSSGRSSFFLETAGCDERGRGRIPVTVFGSRPEAEVLDHYAAAGVDRVLFALPPVDAAEAMKFLDAYAQLAETERS